MSSEFIVHEINVLFCKLYYFFLLFLILSLKSVQSLNIHKSYTDNAYMKFVIKLNDDPGQGLGLRSHKRKCRAQFALDGLSN